MLKYSLLFLLIFNFVVPSLAPAQTPKDFLRQGLSAHDAEQWKDAEELLLKSLAPSNARNPLTLRDKSEANYYLGWALEELGKLPDALSAYRRALEIDVVTLGWDNEDTIAAAVALALVAADLGDYAEAEILYRRALDHDERNFGPDDPATLASLVHLAETLRPQGKLSEATELKIHKFEFF